MFKKVSPIKKLQMETMNVLLLNCQIQTFLSTEYLGKMQQ